MIILFGLRKSRTSTLFPVGRSVLIEKLFFLGGKSEFKWGESSFPLPLYETLVYIE